MARYIDANKVMEEINRTGGHNLCGWQTIGVKALIDRQQTADVVEVVRCKDCVYYEANCCFNRQWDFESSTEIPLVREYDFCSYGEKALKEREYK